MAMQPPLQELANLISSNAGPELLVSAVDRVQQSLQQREHADGSRFSEESASQSLFKLLEHPSDEVCAGAIDTLGCICCAQNQGRGCRTVLDSLISSPLVVHSLLRRSEEVAESIIDCLALLSDDIRCQAFCIEHN